MKKQPLPPLSPKELARSLREFEAGWEAMTGQRVTAPAMNNNMLYVVQLDCDFEGMRLEGIFSSEGKAQHFIDQYEPSSFRHGLRIETWTLDSMIENVIT